MALATVPAARSIRGQLVDRSATICDASATEVLLELELRVGREEDCKAFALSSVEQFAIPELRPAAFERGGNLVLPKKIPQRDRGALVEEDAHSGRSQRAPLRMLQYGAHLLEGDAGEPVDELGRQGAVLEVLEKCCDRYPGTLKYPRSANAVRIPLDCGTGRPIDRGKNASTVASSSPKIPGSRARSHVF